MIALRLVIGQARPFEAIIQRARDGMSLDVRRQLANTMRFGPGSAQDQFNSGGTMSPDGTFRRWPMTVPWGTRTGGGSFASENQDFGATRESEPGYESAWLGGVGSVTEIGNPRAIRIGVDQQRFPQVTVFQALRPTVVRTTNKARMYNRKNFGIRRMPPAIEIVPRRIDVGREAVERAESVIRDYVLTGRVVEY